MTAKVEAGVLYKQTRAVRGGRQNPEVSG